MVMSQSVNAAPSIRFLLSSASCVACLLFALLIACSNSLHWSVSYVDLCLAWRLEPEVFVDLGSPSVNVIEDDGNRSVCFHRAWLRRVVFCNLAGHSVVFVITLRQSPEDSRRMCNDCRIDVEVLLWCVAEGTGKGRGAHGKAFWAHSVDNGTLSSSKLSLVCQADAGSVRLLLAACLDFMILRVSVGAIPFFGHVDLSSEVATVQQRVFWRDAACRICCSEDVSSSVCQLMTRGSCLSDSSSRRGNKDVCL